MHRRKPRIIVGLFMLMLGVFPLLYLLNIDSVERAVLRILPDTQMFFFFTALNGLFWGFSVVSIGLLIYRRTH